MSTLILASGSPWRRRLLKKHGISCSVHVSDFDEIKRHTSPEKLVKINAEGKAKKVAAHYSKELILGVDTVGVIGRKILGKPADRTEAQQMIRRLSGTTHRVISGVCLIDTKTAKKITRVATTYVTFRSVDAPQLSRYLASNHWKGKAGAYAIQGRAKGFVEKIDGELSNVIGVPIELLKKMMMDIKK